MWPFKMKKIEVERYRFIDWSKVTTLQEVIDILSHTHHVSNLQIPEKEWKKYEHILNPSIRKRTYVNGFFERDEEDNGQ